MDLKPIEAFQLLPTLGYVVHLSAVLRPQARPSTLDAYAGVGSSQHQA